MGEPILAGFAVLALLGVSLVVVGALRRRRPPALVGAALLIGLGGAWLFGPLGLALGPFILALAWLERMRSKE